ncbi:MAG: C25 family cysteine peptidase [bacterium]
MMKIKPLLCTFMPFCKDGVPPLPLLLCFMLCHALLRAIYSVLPSFFLCAFIIIPQHLFAATIPQVLPLTIEIAPLEITTAEDGYSIVRAKDCAVSSEVGMPMLPVKTFFVLLPHNSEVEGLEITSIQQQKLDGKYLICPVSPPLPVSGKHKSRDRVAHIATSQTEMSPPAIVQLKSIQRWGGFNLACMQVFGARYDAQSGELIWIKHVEFNLKLKQLQDIPICGRCPNTQLLQKLVINPELIPECKFAPMVEKYLIVTDENLAPAFQGLLDSKISKGMEGTITTLPWIYSHFSGRDNQERIRNYIKDYQPTYLLLGGDTEIVPYRGVYAYVEGGTLADNGQGIMPVENKTGKEEDANIPCDSYYACLDNDWDYDKDGIYGEIEDRVDMMPEVYVGRAPVDNGTQAEQFVTKVLKYGSATGSYPYNEVLIGCELDSLNDGKLIMQAIDEITPGAYIVSHYYQSEGAVKADMIHGLNAGVGFVAHAGHANNYCLQMGGERNNLCLSELSQLLSNPCPFIFNTIGCLAGSFEINDCIGEQMVMNENAGAAAFIGNSRYGLYDETSPLLYSGEYQVEFFRQALREGCSHIGEALSMSKLTFVPQCSTDTPYRWIQYCLNLFGDPEMALPMPRDVQALYQIIQGNVRGIVDPGQQLPLIITLKNFRDNDCGSLSVELSTNDPYVIITTGTVTFDAMPSGETVSNTNQPFGFMLKPNCPYEHRIEFTLTITDATSTCTDAIYLTVSLTVSDMNTIICYPNPCVRGQVITIAGIPAGKDAYVYIYNLSGEMVRQIKATELMAGGSMIARWDTMNDSGERVASGIYFYRLVCSSGIKTGKIGIVR